MLVNTRTTYDEFSNMVLAKENGFYKIYYYCPVCCLELGKELKSNRNHKVVKTILKDNKFPHYCPDCGTRLEYL